MMRNKNVTRLLEEQSTNFGVAIVELRETVKGLRDDLKRKDQMIERLWERLMARDLPELTMYGQQPETQGLDVEYNPFLDEDNAGEILNATESIKTNS